MDNYHSFVRPEIQLRNNLRQQQTAIQQQGDRLHGLRDDVRDLEKDGTTIRATGTNSVFMDYGHYYYSDIRSGAATVRGPGAAHGQPYGRVFGPLTTIRGRQTILVGFHNNLEIQRPPPPCGRRLHGGRSLPELHNPI